MTNFTRQEFMQAAAEELLTSDEIFRINNELLEVGK